MRRKDREMPLEFGLFVIDKCEWAVIGLVDTTLKPYCVPISIVRKDNAIYFHCAKQGKKTDCMNFCGDVCITCVGDTNRLLNEFTTEYESAIVKGKASEVLDKSEAIEALRLLCLRHTPTNMIEFEKEVSASLCRTAVWRVDMIEITAKRKKYGENGIELKFGKME